jgi:hypothetical protein
VVLDIFDLDLGYLHFGALISRKAAKTHSRGEAKKKREKEVLLSFFFSFFSLRFCGFAWELS